MKIKIGLRKFQSLVVPMVARQMKKYLLLDQKILQDADDNSHP